MSGGGDSDAVYAVDREVCAEIGIIPTDSELQLMIQVNLTSFTLHVNV